MTANAKFVAHMNSHPFFKTPRLIAKHFISTMF